MRAPSPLITEGYPLTLDRLTESPGGQLRYHFRRAWSDGSTALLLDPLELLERLAVEVRTSLRVDATPTALDVHLQLDVQRDGTDFFHRTWEETIERRLL